MCQQGDGHDCLAQAHLISQDAIQAASVDGHEPVQPNVLVLPQPMLQQEGHLISTQKAPNQYTSNTVVSTQQHLISTQQHLISTKVAPSQHTDVT